MTRLDPLWCAHGQAAIARSNIGGESPETTPGGFTCRNGSPGLSPKPLPPGEVHLWCADPTEMQSADEAEALELLADEERARLARFRFKRDRMTFLTTRVLVRVVLSRYEQTAPAAWRFEANDYGRPRVAGETDTRIRFNLSNTEGLVVCAVTYDAEVGVDVERLRHNPPLEVAETFFAPEEVVAIRALPAADQPRRFYDYWTLKESYIKALGVGLAMPLDRFTFDFPHNGMPRVRVAGDTHNTEDRWQFIHVRPTDAHLVAVCVGPRCRGAATVEVNWQSIPALVRSSTFFGE